MVVISSHCHALRRVSAHYNNGVVPEKRCGARRTNKQSIYDVPDGYFMCPYGPCRQLIASEDADIRYAICLDGHQTDLYEAASLELSPGGRTHVGLSLTQQGALAEAIVVQLSDLGEYGTVVGLSGVYRCPLDGWTSANYGIEVKSTTTLGMHLRFVAGSPRTKAAKNQYARERGYRGIVGILVHLDFATSTAEVHLRHMPSGIRNFDKPDVPFAVVGFDNPFRPQQELPAEEVIPF